MPKFSCAYPAGQIDVNLEKQIQTFNQLIKETRPAYEYKLVFNRDGSRKVLLEALETAKERLILVCPWMTYRGADGEVMQLCRKFLHKKGILEIGWGHLSDTSLEKHEPMTEEDFLREVAAPKQYGNRVTPGKNADFWYKQKLNEFKQLQQEYPNQINLKLLGTHEKFLVCDDTFAMLGSHNFLTSGDSSTERELGLKTEDKNIIKKLIERFECAPNLDNSSNINHKELYEIVF
jgi:phosphatidylserine/phosphatidylglycerophosphate/cardiolipin synthase-like enzyme